VARSLELEYQDVFERLLLARAAFDLAFLPTLLLLDQHQRVDDVAVLDKQLRVDPMGLLRIEQEVLYGPSSSADSEDVLELLLLQLFLQPNAVAPLQAAVFLRESSGALGFGAPPIRDVFVQPLDAPAQAVFGALLQPAPARIFVLQELVALSLPRLLAECAHSQVAFPQSDVSPLQETILPLASVEGGSHHDLSETATAHFYGRALHALGEFGRAHFRQSDGLSGLRIWTHKHPLQSIRHRSAIRHPVE